MKANVMVKATLPSLSDSFAVMAAVYTKLQVLTYEDYMFGRAPSPARPFITSIYLEHLPQTVMTAVATSAKIHTAQAALLLTKTNLKYYCFL